MPVSEYLLNQKETEKSVDKLSDKLTGKLLKDMFASEDQKEFARNILIPIIENETAKRRTIQVPSDEQMIAGLRCVLEEAAEEVGNEEEEN